jgi:hypothetical protein
MVVKPLWLNLYKLQEVEGALEKWKALCLLNDINLKQLHPLVRLYNGAISGYVSENVWPFDNPLTTEGYMRIEFRPSDKNYNEFAAIATDNVFESIVR